MRKIASTAATDSATTSRAGLRAGRATRPSLAVPCGRKEGLPSARSRDVCPGSEPALRDTVAVVGAERARRLFGEGVAVPLAVGRAHERRDDLEGPLAVPG